MKKIISTSIFIACIIFCGYNISLSLFSTPTVDVFLSDIDALAQSEGGSGGCGETLTNSRVQYYSDGSYRMVGEYSCGAGIGSCHSGTVYIYCNSNGYVIGTDDQRHVLYCA